MKKYIFLFSAIWFFQSFIMGQSCLPEGLNYYYQEDVDSFPSLYPDCQDIEGGIKIVGNYVYSLDSLYNIITIGGDLTLQWSHSIENFTGLENLISIGGDLYIHNTTTLKKFIGLTSLKYVEGNIIIDGNIDLESFVGLDSLVYCGGDFIIDGNSLAMDMFGFHALQEIGGKLSITNNNELNSLFINETIQSIGEDLLISNNENLMDMEGIKNVTVNGDTIWISDNPLLEDFSGVGNIDSYQERIYLSNNALLQSFSGFENIQSFLGILNIKNNESLASFSGLESLIYIYGLNISENKSLKNLSGLVSLDSARFIDIYENDSLINFQGLSSLNEVSSLYIANNKSLINFSGLNNLERINYSIFIENNESLINFEGLESLNHVDYYFSVRENPSLIDFMGLSGLDSLDCYFPIKYNDNLESLMGFDNLVYIDNLVISGNPLLQNFQGFENVSKINRLQVQYCNSLQNLQGLENINYFSSLDIANNENLIDLSGLNNLQMIDNNLYIYGNESLGNLLALETLTRIGNGLYISSNNILQNLHGLENCTEFSGEVNIRENLFLTNIEGMSNFPTDSITELRIEDNPMLSECAVESVCGSIANNVDVHISNNMLGCNNIDQVVAACEMNIIQPWTQVGEDLTGLTSFEEYGTSVSINSDGTIIAIGGIRHYIDGNLNPGYVRIFKNVENNWVQLGEDIIGEENLARFGRSVSLSSSGLILAIGAIYNSTNGEHAGQVRIFKFENNTWTQVGNSINGEQNDFSGRSINLSANGNVVAIGSVGGSVNGQYSGKVRVYSNNLGEWIQLGNDLNGEYAEDYFGDDVSLNFDGSVLAVGASSSDNSGKTIGINYGAAYFYHLDGNSWVQTGVVFGDDTWDHFGSSIDLNYLGNRVAVGAPLYGLGGEDKGYVKVFQSVDNNWIQVGNNIEGEGGADSFGTAVSMDSLGINVAIGAPGNDGMEDNAGHVRVHALVDDEWEQVGRDIDFPVGNSCFGNSICMAYDGVTFISGAPNNDSFGEDKGQARVYTLKPIILVEPYNANNSCIDGLADFILVDGGDNTYQWQESLDNSGWNNIFDNSIFQGANTKHLTVVVDTLMPQYFYRNIITNEYGELETNAVQILIDTIKPVFSIPGIVEVLADSSHTYTIEGAEYDPISASDNCGIVSLINDYSNTESLAGISLPEGDHIIVWIAKDFVGNETIEFYHFVVHQYLSIYENINNKFIVYPIPANTTISLIIPNDFNAGNVEIFDLNGRLVQNKAQVSETDNKIDVEELPSGFYTIRLIGEQNIYVGKFVKE